MSGKESAAVQDAISAVEGGSSVLAAARQFDCAPSSIRRAMRRRGIPPREQLLSGKALQVADLIRSGHAIKDAAEQVGTSLSVAYHAIHRASQLREKAGPRQVEVTPLLSFIRELNIVPERLEAFVASLELVNGKATTGTYLYQLAGNPVPNPTLRLAAAIVQQSRAFAHAMDVPPLSYEDLLVGQLSRAAEAEAPVAHGEA